MRCVYRAWVLGLLGSALALCAQNQAVAKAEREWAQAVAARDFDLLEQILSDELIYAHSTGVIESKREYLEKLKSGQNRYDQIEHEKMTIKVFGSAAVAHSIVRMRGQSSGQPFDNRLMMMHTWIHQNGRWRLVAHQTTRLGP